MSIQGAVNLVFSFLGGGVVVTMLNWVHAARAEIRNRRATIVSDQLNKLYGPLFFFTLQNDELFKVLGRFNEAYTAPYVVKKWSDQEGTREALRITNISYDCTYEHLYKTYYYGEHDIVYIAA